MARTDRLKANTALSRDNAVFMAGCAFGRNLERNGTRPNMSCSPALYVHGVDVNKDVSYERSSGSAGVVPRVAEGEPTLVQCHDRRLGHVILNRQEHGLDAAGLTVDRVLSWLGFQQRSGTCPYFCAWLIHSCACTGPVEVLKHPVSSRYCHGIFLQHPDSSGNVYNVRSQM